jgi:uncharacterized membrane protein YeaQ/YmgE (transglycosylase-associated protein family)
MAGRCPAKSEIAAPHNLSLVLLPRRNFVCKLVNGRFAADDHAEPIRVRGGSNREEDMDIDLQSLIIWLLIGAIAGWLAGQIMKGGGFGLVGDIIVGIVGAFIAGILFPRLGFAFGNPIVGSIIAAVVGACLLLFILRLVRRGP